MHLRFCHRNHDLGGCHEVQREEIPQRGEEICLRDPQTGERMIYVVTQIRRTWDHDAQAGRMAIQQIDVHVVPVQPEAQSFNPLTAGG